MIPMEQMPFSLVGIAPEWIAVILFFLVLVFIAFFYRKGTLDKLEGLKGESILAEEEPVRVEQTGGPRTTIFPRCKIRLTTHRLIIAQKVPLRKHLYVLRAVILLYQGENRTELGSTLRSGYLQLALRPKELTIQEIASSLKVNIAIPSSALTIQAGLSFSLQTEEATKAFRNLIA